MFSNTVKSFIILNIYFLMGINALLILGIYGKIIKDRFMDRRRKKTTDTLKPIVMAYIKDEDGIHDIQGASKDEFTQNIIIDIMVAYSEKNDADLSGKFEALMLDQFILGKLKSRADIIYLRKLAFMRVVSGYELLLKHADSEDLDIKYMCFFALSWLDLTMDQEATVIKKMVASDIVSDRIIEILNQFRLTTDEWLALLEQETTVGGKSIFIKNLSLKEDMKKPEHSDRIFKYLEDEREVKIAAIHALSHSQNEKYLDDLIRIYQTDEHWQVRVAVAKGLSNFNFDRTQDVLLKMTRDKEWWVRFNAIKSIVAKGDEGLFTLIDLSLEVEDKHVADLAYYFLNSNKDVYDTVKNIEV